MKNAQESKELTIKSRILSIKLLIENCVEKGLTKCGVTILFEKEKEFLDSLLLLGYRLSKATGDFQEGKPKNFTIYWV